jgi:hypothetical protein
MAAVRMLITAGRITDIATGATIGNTKSPEHRSGLFRGWSFALRPE